MPAGNRPHLELIAEQGVFVSVEKLCPKLHRAGGEPAEVTHAPAHDGARLNDDNTPPPGAQHRLQRFRCPQPREAGPHHHHGRLRRRRHPGPRHPPPGPSVCLSGGGGGVALRVQSRSPGVQKSITSRPPPPRLPTLGRRQRGRRARGPSPRGTAPPAIAPRGGG